MDSVVDSEGTGKPAAPPGQLRRAAEDLLRGTARVSLWGMLGWHDIKLRYRRSVLGPFWSALAIGMHVGALGYVFGRVMNTQAETYVPYVGAGMVAWTLLAAFLQEGCGTYVGAERLMRQARLPYTVLSLRMIWRNLILFVHNLAVVLVLWLYFEMVPGWRTLMVIPALALCALNGWWVSIILGVISARFRDVPHLTGAVLRVAFFLTPIIWSHERFPQRAVFVEANPFFHFVQLIRAPLLDQAISPHHWVVVGGITVVGWVAALVTFVLFRRRIPYWL